MAAKSKADRLKELDAQRKAIESEPDEDEDYEVEVGDKDGNYYRGPRSKVRKWAQARGFEEPDPEPEPDEDEDEDKPKPRKAQGKQGGQVRQFRGASIRRSS